MTQGKNVGHRVMFHTLRAVEPANFKVPEQIMEYRLGQKSTFVSYSKVTLEKCGGKV